MDCSYANDVMLNSVGLQNEPKYSHLGALHSIIAQYSNQILSQVTMPMKLLSEFLY
jgi:hypothetical protein